MAKKSQHLYFFCSKALGVLVHMEADFGSCFDRSRRHILLACVDLTLALLCRGVVNGRAGLQPAEAILPLQDLALHRLLCNPLSREIGPRRPSAPHHLPVPGAPHEAEALSFAFALSFPRALGLSSLCHHLGVLADLLQCNFGCTLLSLLFRRADVACPHAASPIARQGLQLHCRLVTPTGISLCLVDGLALLKIALRNLHDQGIQLRFRRHRGVVAFLGLLCLLSGELSRREPRSLLLLLRILACRRRQRCHLRLESHDGLLSGGLFRLLLVQTKVASVLLALNAIQLDNALVLVPELVRGVRDIGFRDRSLAVPLAKVVELRLRVCCGSSLHRGGSRHSHWLARCGPSGTCGCQSQAA
mmetsp:Transcript_65614/g.153520  ORF Transcript_65614/g.153520 Transcript_65614/m.153520 type:complete len:360 (-) Transcript_65614:16-1095(-)